MSEAKQPQAPNQPVIGYRKPPVRSRFRKGQCGNPGGRPRGPTPGRVAALLETELFRPIKVNNGDKAVTMPALRAVVRQLIALATTGNISASRLVLEFAREIERLAAQAPPTDGKPVYVLVSEADRRL